MVVTMLGLTEQLGKDCISESEVQRHILLLKNPKTPAGQRAQSEKLLLSKYYPLILQQVKHYTDKENVVIDPDDFVSAALIAFTKALQMFSPTHKCKFITILWKSLQNELIGVFRTQYRQHSVEACPAAEFREDFEQDENEVVKSPETPEENVSVRSEEEFDLQRAETIRNGAQITTDESLLIFLAGTSANGQENLADIKAQVGVSLTNSNNLRMRYITQFRENIRRAIDEKKPSTWAPKDAVEMEKILSFELTTAESLLIQLKMQAKQPREKAEVTKKKGKKAQYMEVATVTKFLKSLSQEAERVSTSALVRVNAHEYATV